MKTLKEALISKNKRDWAATDKPSKYILVPHGDFYSKMCSNKEYIDKKFNDCPCEFLWIIDENDLIELEQNFYRYDYKLFVVPPGLSDNKLKRILETIRSNIQFADNNFIKMEEDELFNLIKRLKKIKRK